LDVIRGDFEAGERTSLFSAIMMAEDQARKLSFYHESKVQDRDVLTISLSASDIRIAMVTDLGESRVAEAALGN
jgi:hypothetical protein